MAQRQANFPLSRRQKRRPRRTKPASIHLLVAAAFAITTIIFYAINYLYHSRTTHVANLDDTVQNDRIRNEEEHRIEDDRGAPETGKAARARALPLLHFYISFEHTFKI